jgi:hypothetical protein
LRGAELLLGHLLAEGNTDAWRLSFEAHVIRRIMTAGTAGLRTDRLIFPTCRHLPKARSLSGSWATFAPVYPGPNIFAAFGVTALPSLWRNGSWFDGSAGFCTCKVSRRREYFAHAKS